MRVHFFKPTDDNWHPPFRMQDGTTLVRVAIGQSGPCPPKNGKWLVVACGNDDFILSKEFEKEHEAIELFRELAMWDRVNVNDLLMIGFES